MKKNSPNLIVNLQNNFITIQKSHSLTSKRVTLFLVFAFFGTSIIAQTNTIVTPQIMAVDSYISSLKTSELTTNSSFSNAQNLEDLLYKVQSSIYFYSGVGKTYGDKPKNLYTDVASLNGLLNSNLLKNNIEIAIIKINSNNLNSTIDLNVFSNFYKLKYIYILSSIPITEQEISKMILNYDEQYSIFYKIEKGE